MDVSSTTEDLADSMFSRHSHCIKEKPRPDRVFLIGNPLTTHATFLSAALSVVNPRVVLNSSQGRPACRGSRTPPH